MLIPVSENTISTKKIIYKIPLKLYSTGLQRYSNEIK